MCFNDLSVFSHNLTFAWLLNSIILRVLAPGSDSMRGIQAVCFSLMSPVNCVLVNETNECRDVIFSVAHAPSYMNKVSVFFTGVSYLM